MVNEEEYEVIPTSPLRRLEKRIEKIEEGSASSQVSKLISDVMELIKSNQRIIDEVIKRNNELIVEISKVPKKIDELVFELREFMKILKASAEEEEVSEVSKEAMAPLVEKFSELVEQNKKTFETTQAMLTTLGVIEKRLKRLGMQLATPAASEYSYGAEGSSYSGEG